MREPTRPYEPGALAENEEVPASGSLRREVDELLGSAGDEAAADLAPVSRGCRAAELLKRGQAIRARNGLPPNPVGARRRRTDRESRALGARARQVRRGRTESGKTPRAVTAAGPAVAKRLWRLSRRAARQLLWMWR